MNSTAPPTPPFHLRGNYAPIDEEFTAGELEVRGRLPLELSGMYLRNGPNPRPGQPSPIWFLGQGMLHGVRLEGGRALSYRNRWVKGPSTSNTHVIRHAGRVLSLVETAAPVEVNGDLESIGPFDFGGRLTRGMTAHPKTCPRTGELLFFTYSLEAPYLLYYRANAVGKILQAEPVKVGAPTYMHDFAISDTHTVFFDLPLLYHGWRAPVPVEWRLDYGARIGVLARDGLGSSVRWFVISPCVMSHTVNAFDDGRWVVIDAIRGQCPGAPTTLWRYRVNLATGCVEEHEIDPHHLEFPRINERRIGLPYRFVYLLELRDVRDGAPSDSVLRKLDLVSGCSQTHPVGAGRVCGEVVFVPRQDAAREDDGWLLGFVYDRLRNVSQLTVIDAVDVAAPPVATVDLPTRVPFGFHGSWLPDPA